MSRGSLADIGSEYLKATVRFNAEKEKHRCNICFEEASGEEHTVDGLKVLH